MRITGFHIDGFGLLHDARVEGVGPGLTVVLGPNEAGKSTLHAFLVRSLLGHPRTGNAAGRAAYQPLRGGRLGGSVTLRDAEDGRWEVHRQPGRNPALRVVRPDGSDTTNPSAISDLMGPRMDIDRFEQVFAIDVDALSGLGDLRDETLQELLFDAASVGTGRSLRGARDEALRRRDGLWTRKASTRPLPVALERRAEATRTLREARAVVASVGRLRDERDVAADEVERLRAAQVRVHGEVARLGRVRDAWPAWQALRATDEQGTTPGPAPVATATVESEAAARAAVTEATSALDERDAELAQIAQEMDAVVLDDRLDAVAERVRELHGRLPLHEVELDRIAAAHEARRGAAETLAVALSELGPGWDEAAVRSVATDGASHEALRAAADALGDARRIAEQTGRTAADGVTTVNQMLAGLERRRADHAQVPDSEQVRMAEEAVALLRGRVPAIERGLLTPVAPVAGPSASVWLVIGLLALGLAVAAVTLGEGMPALLLGGVCLGGAVVAAYLAGRARVAGGATGADEPRERSAAIRAEIAQAAGMLGLEALPSLAEVEQVAGRIATARARVEAAAAVARDLRDLEHAHEDARAVSDQAALASGAAVEMLMDAQLRWQAVCEQVGVDADEEPRVVLARHARVVEAARAADVVTRAHDAASPLATAIATYRGEVEQVLGDAGVVVADGADAVRALPALRERVEADAEGRRELARLATARDRVAARHATHEQRLATARDTLTRCWQEVGVTDAAGFEARVAADEARAARDRARAAAAARVNELLGTGEESDAGRRMLAQADPVRWDAELARLADELERLDHARDEAVRTHARLTQQVAELGSHDAVPRAEQALDAAQAEIDELAERWAVADVAARLLGATLERFEREQQPVVLKRASGLLSAATLGEWAQVRRLDERLVVARAAGGDPCDVGALSRGTREQLYLALRLALAEELSGERRLPLLIDDLLGASDPERSEAVARLLADVAARHQVWLFTPEPATAALLLRSSPGARVLELGRGGQLLGWREGSDGSASPPSASSASSSG